MALLSYDDALARLRHYRDCSDYVVAFCPAHENSKTPALSIRRGAQGEALLKCFAGCPAGAIARTLRGEYVKRTLGLPQHEDRAPIPDAIKISWALRLWREAKPAAGTIVETYLRNRGIRITVPRSIRFHPHLKDKETNREYPGLIAAIQQANGAITGVLRIFLTRDGHKADLPGGAKRMLGVCAGGAVRLGRVAETIALTEGIETALSIAQSIPNLVVWAALSTSGLKSIDLPNEVRNIYIAADNDENGAGQKAASAAADRLLRIDYTRKVKIVIPPAGDWNDVINPNVQEHHA